MDKIKKINIPLLLGTILISQLAGIIGSFFTFSAITDWYAYLNKPSFSPPNYLFGPVWITLYTLMGISFYIVLRSTAENRSRAIKVFLVQLVLNAIWSILFFGLRNPAIAFVEIVFLWIFIILTIKEFSKISKVASYLLYPYLAWVTFASLLNFAIWQLN